MQCFGSNAYSGNCMPVRATDSCRHARQHEDNAFRLACTTTCQCCTKQQQILETDEVCR